jgi:hypothetical protein
MDSKCRPSAAEDSKHFRTMCFTRDRLIAIYDSLQARVAQSPTAENISLAKSLDNMLTCPVCGVYAPKLNGAFRLAACGCSICKSGCFTHAAASSMCPRCDRSLH